MINDPNSLKGDWTVRTCLLKKTLNEFPKEEKGGPPKERLERGSSGQEEKGPCGLCDMTQQERNKKKKRRRRKNRR